MNCCDSRWHSSRHSWMQPGRDGPCQPGGQLAGGPPSESVAVAEQECATGVDCAEFCCRLWIAITLMKER